VFLRTLQVLNPMKCHRGPILHVNFAAMPPLSEHGRSVAELTG
jgi:hypothetical protein